MDESNSIYQKTNLGPSTVNPHRREGVKPSVGGGLVVGLRVCFGVPVVRALMGGGANPGPTPLGRSLLSGSLQES